jgi:phage baseplate assembly protein gpV
MTTDLVTLIRSVVRDTLVGHRTASLGVVTKLHAHAADPDLSNGEVDLRLRDTGTELFRVPVVAPRIGTACPPNVGDLVVVHFLDGDINRALVHGAVHNDTQRPPPAKAQEFVHVSPDARSPGVRRAELTFPNGDSFTLDDVALTLEMGKTKVTIAHDGSVEIASAAKITLSSSAAAEIEAKGSLTLKAGGEVSVEGASVAITGKAGAKIDGGAKLDLKGGLVGIAGQTDFAPA